MDSLISRQAAIDTIADKLDPPHQVDGSEFEKGCAAQWTKDWNVVMRALDKLPSAQPELCEDAVSRSDVEIEIANLLKGVFVEYEDIAKKVAARLPSVTPKRKTGKWIKRDVSRQIHGISCSAPNYQCSVCKKWWFHNGEGLKWYKFCPECGADMIGEQNEQTI